MTEIKPGMFGLSEISGPTGKLIKWGQAIVDRHNDKFTHAFLVVDPQTVIEAEPGGAKLAPLEKYTSRPEGSVLFSDLPIQLEVAKAQKAWAKVGMTFAESDAAQTYEDILRRRVVLFGRQCEGIPYNYLDYFALALERFNVKIGPVEKRIQREDRMICSQLVDWAYLQVGLHLFDDGRLPFNVTPGDLEEYIRAHS